MGARDRVAAEVAARALALRRALVFASLLKAFARDRRDCAQGNPTGAVARAAALEIAQAPRERWGPRHLRRGARDRAIEPWTSHRRESIATPGMKSRRDRPGVARAAAHDAAIAR